MELELFIDDWGIDDSKPDDTEITTTILYFSKEELSEFKKLCKSIGKKLAERGHTIISGRAGGVMGLLIDSYKENSDLGEGVWRKRKKLQRSVS